MNDDVITKEIKGINFKTIAWILGGIIMIEFTVIMTYANIMNQLKDSVDRIAKVENTQNKIIEKQTDFDRRISLIEFEQNMKK